jgi:outer membrane protein assembly factor BamB
VQSLLVQYLIAVAAAATIAAVARADDWPVVRGNIHGSGVAATPVSDDLDVLWTYKTGEDAGFDATAVVVGGIVYVGDNMGTFHAVRLADGKPEWTKQFEDSGFGAGAAIDKDRLYVGDLNGIVRCLSTTDGAEQWKVDLQAEIYAGPTPTGDDVLITSEAGTLTCLNAANGKKRWQFTIEAPLRCAPTIGAGRVMLAGCDSKLHFIDVASGAEVHSVDIDGPTGSTAAMNGDRAYFGTEGGSFYAIVAPASQDQKPVVAWTFRDPQRGQPIRAAAAVTDSIVVFGSQGKAIYALDPASGEQKWKLPTRTRVESSPVIAGDRVVAATVGGIVYLLDAATSEPKWQYEAGGSFTASPAVVDGRVILGNGNGTLYCFGVKTKEE